MSGFDTYEDGHAQALADHSHGVQTDFNAMGCSYSFIQGYLATQASLKALDTDARENEERAR